MGQGCFCPKSFLVCKKTKEILFVFPWSIEAMHSLILSVALHFVSWIAFFCLHLINFPHSRQRDHLKLEASRVIFLPASQFLGDCESLSMPCWNLFVFATVLHSAHRVCQTSTFPRSQMPASIISLLCILLPIPSPWLYLLTSSHLSVVNLHAISIIS